MRRFLFDSWIASDYINRRHGVRERAHDEVAKGNKIGICMPVLAELYFGVELSTSRDRNLQRLHHALSSVTLWPVTQNGAAIYGRIAADLRRSGRPMQIVDTMAAAIAIDLGNCTVVSNDGDLWAVPGLAVEKWAQS
jgi:tRNA(fMet)-specific endonuclease VapC